MEMFTAFFGYALVPILSIGIIAIFIRLFYKLWK